MRPATLCPGSWPAPSGRQQTVSCIPALLPLAAEDSSLLVRSKGLFREASSGQRFTRTSWRQRTAQNVLSVDIDGTQRLMRSRWPARSDDVRWLVRLAGVRQNFGVRIALLGPFEVLTFDGTLVAVPGARLRALLAALALEPGRIVSRERLVDWIWGPEPPTDEVNALQALVSRLRRVLPDGVIEAESGGYRFAVAPDVVDVSRFEHLVGRARGAEPAERADLLRCALELWRGSAMADIALRGGDARPGRVGTECRGLDRVPADARAARRGAGRRPVGRALRAARRVVARRAGRACGEPQDEPARRADQLRRQGRRRRRGRRSGRRPPVGQLDGAGWFRQDKAGHGDRTVDPRRSAGWGMVGGVGPGARGRRAGAGRPCGDRLA